MIADRVPYSPITERPRLTWPGGARVAVWVVPNIEHYEFLPNPVGPRDPWPRMPHPDILGYGLRDYGNRVGLWRLAEVTDKLGIPCQSEWDDVQLLWHRHLLTPKFPALVEAGFSVLHEEGAASGRSFTLGVHPWLFGMPHRIRYLDEALTRLAGFGQVWNTTLEGIAEHFGSLRGGDASEHGPAA